MMMLLPPVSAQYTDSCNMQQEQYAFANATAAYGAYMAGLKDSIENLYVSKCLGAYRLDSFSYMHPNAEYHFTLYYYDQAGNLVKTIPPAGVDLYHQHHTMATRYRYNTLNQVVEQMTPDAGRSLMWYDRIGKVTFSQNARQKPNGQYSYTLYDPLQRIIEVGQWGGADTIDRYGAVDTVALGDWYGFLQTFGTQLTEVTHTYYDYDTLHIHDTLGVAENMYLRNRVASTTYADVLDRSNIHNYQSGSHYLYDIHGNVSTLLQENTSLRRIGQQWKKINYDYDLVSGKVNEVIYQPGKPDMFIHAYDYDADNRLTDVRTTRDSVIWDHDASYSYYKHGPLARMELGDAKVQAMNYAYTIQGWLKGVNGLDPEHNIGRDGESSGVNSIVAKSEMGYALTYYKGDYQPISRIFATNLRPVEGDYTNLDIRSLYNGNIALMQLNLPKVGLAQAYRYSYDQLNRITGMLAYTGLTQPGNNPLGFHTATWSSSTALPDYAEKVNYDPNGNIAFYNRHGNSGTNIDMDSMLYRYLPGTNKLDHVDDAVAATNYSVDIDDQDTLNYRYDQIGNLTKDASEGIDSIKWTLYGKLQEIDKHNGDTIKFAYDPMGHRIMKEVYKDSTHHKKGTYYIHDGTGNIMATYDWENIDTFKLNDLMMYGSSRLGSIDVGLLMCDTINNDSVTNASRSTCCGSSISGVVYHTYGIKQYELSNHLGNVLATITDRHIPVYTGPSGSLSYYKADVASAQDYYPFGMQMPGRIFAGQYRFGFNGHELDNEIYGKGNSYSTFFRELDVRLGRWWSLDPKINAFESPYLSVKNSPIMLFDLLGDVPNGEKSADPVKDPEISADNSNKNANRVQHGFVGSRSHHKGVDILASKNTPVKAIMSGTVVSVINNHSSDEYSGKRDSKNKKAPTTGLGNTVIVKTTMKEDYTYQTDGGQEYSVKKGDVVFIKYSHLDVGYSYLKGQEVIAGETTIGESGATGNPGKFAGTWGIKEEFRHVHIEARVGGAFGKVIDPEGFIGSNFDKNGDRKIPDTNTDPKYGNVPYKGE